MVSTRNSTLIKSELIRYIASLGLDIKTVTKARGNKGFFREGRIDVSKTLDDDSSIKTIVHEYAHFVHHRLDKNINDLDILFGENSCELIDELVEVTNFVDKNSLCGKLIIERDRLKENIDNLCKIIKMKYPDFSLTDDFKPFKKYSGWSNIRYLEKYDKVKVHSIGSNKIYSVETVKEDFPDIPEEFEAYLKLKSKQRKRTKISRRITKLNKYYSEPCELFARFVEGLYIDIDKVKTLAPNAFERFIERYNKNYYYGLREIFSILRVLVY